MPLVYDHYYTPISQAANPKRHPLVGINSYTHLKVSLKQDYFILE
jgi:hypothetical protein